jgi:hypothetical protein
MKNYGVRFGSGDPRTYTGLNPTFLFFVNMATGATVTPPSITELFANTGIYNFQWGTTTPISFLCDAATTSPGTTGRYVVGQLDPNDRNDEYSTTLLAYSVTIRSFSANIAVNANDAWLNTITIIDQNVTILATVNNQALAFGSTASSFGTSAADPVDLFGYLKRIQENLEGNNSFTKSSGVFTILSRGSSYTLASKTISNSISMVTKL